MPRQTKADRILNDAAMRLEAARIRERTAQSQLNVATATLKVLQEAYDALERELAPKSRTKAATAQTAPAKPATTKAPKAEANSNGAGPETPVANCGICGNPKDHADHDRTYLKSHDFEPPKSVATATRRSSRKAAAANSTPNSETNSEGALAVGAGGD